MMLTNITSTSSGMTCSIYVHDDFLLGEFVNTSKSFVMRNTWIIISDIQIEQLQVEFSSAGRIQLEWKLIAWTVQSQHRRKKHECIKIDGIYWMKLSVAFLPGHQNVSAQNRFWRLRWLLCMNRVPFEDVNLAIAMECLPKLSQNLP